ncbi:hypothetical protein NLM27_13015 [Bradyrhizobium sp. CCGB12]|uniref:hypothetical protein n=1 Tax=Bradyrhizobium sp. CCGB12 TaxID=2949632 RepID=UPI0020B1DA0E|nr:hypothetical protein [Bradyrhizobium sp. CCGB12]MCP3389695.1 hypothetical protein [Bradyrhizobium sp. CCGB12]
MTRAFARQDMPAMRQADDGELIQRLSVRAVPLDRHRVHGRLDIPATKNFATKNFSVENLVVQSSCTELVTARAFIDR